MGFLGRGPALRKVDVRFGTWTVSSLYRAGLRKRCQKINQICWEYKRSDGTEVALNQQTNIWKGEQES
jgi:hypothetical protein